MERIRKPDAFINISTSDLFDELARIERQWSLPQTSLRELRWFTSREETRKAGSMKIEGGELDRVPFNAEAARGGKPFPSYEQLLTPASKCRIEKVYAIDFAAYGEFL